jgi:hypothetical protein
MSDDLERRLGELLDTYDHGKTVPLRAQASRDAEAKNVAAEWDEIRDNYIAPTLNRIADLLASHGHSAGVTVGVASETQGAPIEIDFRPGKVHTGTNLPGVRFTPLSGAKREVEVRSTSTGLAASTQRHGFASISAAFTETRVLPVVELAFSANPDEHSRDW